MEAFAFVKSIPLGALIAVLVLLPLATGLLAFVLRNGAARVAIVIATAWALTGASLLLFLLSAQEKTVLHFTPGPIGSVEWETIVTVVDGVLLLAFCALGAMRRSPLIFGLAIVQLAAYCWFEFGTGKHPSGGPALTVDWLTVIMVLIISIIGSIIATYALPYMREHEAHDASAPSKQPRFFLLILLFLGAMNGLVCANNLLWLICFWEITTLCSYLLIGHDGTEEAMKNASRALWMNLLGGAGLLAAAILLARQDNTLSIREVLELGAKGGPTQTALLLPLACICFAGFTKAAQMPFQGWLLGAMVAPTPVSALLHSSTMVKAGVYLIVRFAPAFHDTRLSSVVALAGGFTFVAGALLAIGQTNAKALLAYSTISNLGLIIACAGLNTPIALTGAVMLIVFHALSKALLFMATGVVDHNIHSKDIEEMQGLVTRMPLTTTVMVIGILSMLLPPFGVLIAKLVALEASIQNPPVMIMLVIGSTLTVVFWTKWTGRLLTSAPGEKHESTERLHSMYLIPLCLLALGAVGFSLLVAPVLTNLVMPAVQQYYIVAYPTQHGLGPMGEVLKFPWGVVAAALVVAVAVPMLWMRSKKEDVRGAYLCGEQVTDAPTVTFTGAADVKTELVIRGYYFDRIVGENMHRRWMTTVGIGLCILLFGVASLWK